MSTPNSQSGSSSDFPGAKLPGVYVVDSQQAARELTRQATAAGFIAGWIDAAANDTKAAFLAESARELHFPDYFGHNWDAFNDCVRDLGYMPGNGVVIVVDQFDRFAGHDPQQWSIALNVLREAASDSRREGNPIYVLLCGPAAAAPGIPAW